MRVIADERANALVRVSRGCEITGEGVDERGVHPTSLADPAAGPRERRPRPARTAADAGQASVPSILGVWNVPPKTRSEAPTLSR